MMRSIIVDQEAISALSPSAISAFARNNGWEVRRRYREYADLYYNQMLEAEILFPRSSQLVDYPTIVSNLLEVFSSQLERSQEEIYTMLLDAEYDVFRVRALGAHDDGTIDIEGGLGLIEQAKEALLAAACAITAPQPVYRAGANREAADFLKTVRLGQTMHGSYIVNLLNRVPPLLQPTLNDDWSPISDEPMERKVSRRLVEALSALRVSVEEVSSGGGLEQFESSVSAGVSANMCEALSKMINSVDEVELSVEWAATRPAPVKVNRFRFNDDDAVIFREAARKLREKRPRPNVMLYGVVNKLARQYEENDGTVTFKADIDGQMQSVSATLDQSNYEAAVMAHRSKFPVVVNGDLERVGSRWHLINASIRALEATAGDDQDEDEGETSHASEL